MNITLDFNIVMYFLLKLNLVNLTTLVISYLSSTFFINRFEISWHDIHSLKNFLKFGSQWSRSFLVLSLFYEQNFHTVSQRWLNFNSFWMFSFDWKILIQLFLNKVNNQFVCILFFHWIPINAVFEWKLWNSLNVQKKIDFLIKKKKIRRC